MAHCFLQLLHVLRIDALCILLRYIRHILRRASHKTTKKPPEAPFQEYNGFWWFFIGVENMNYVKGN